MQTQPQKPRYRYRIGLIYQLRGSPKWHPVTAETQSYNRLARYQALYQLTEELKTLDPQIKAIQWDRETYVQIIDQ